MIVTTSSKEFVGDYKFTPGAGSFSFGYSGFGHQSKNIVSVRSVPVNANYHIAELNGPAVTDLYAESGGESLTFQLFGPLNNTQVKELSITEEITEL